MAARAPGRGEVGDILAYLGGEVKRLGVTVTCGASSIEALLDAQTFDHVVVASGSLPEVPLIKGIAQTRMQLVSVVDLFEEAPLHGDRVLILGGGQGAL